MRLNTHVTVWASTSVSCRLVRSNIWGSCSWSRSDPVMLLADNSACVAIVVVTVVHLDASHSTPTGHARSFSCPPCSLPHVVVDLHARAWRQMWLAVLRLHYYLRHRALVGRRSTTPFMLPSWPTLPTGRATTKPIDGGCKSSTSHLALVVDSLPFSLLFGASFLPHSPSSYPASASVR